MIHKLATTIKTSNTITLLSINTNSWKLHKNNLLPAADILMLQETRLTAKGQRDEDKFLNGQGFVAHWGAACSQVCRNKTSGRIASSCTGIGKQGGVGILCKKGLGLTPTSRPFNAQVLHQTARWCRAAIPLARSGAKAHKWIHLISFYNISGRDNGHIKSRKERLLSDVFLEGARLGDQPTLICADCNTSVQTSGAIATALTSGKWFDVAAHFTGSDPAKTFCLKTQWDEKCATRPDMIFANKSALSLIDSYRVVEDLSPKGHRGLELRLRFDFVPSHFKCLKQPKAFPVHKLAAVSKHNRDKLGQQCVDNHLARITEARRKGPDEAWRAFSKMAEEYLRQGCQESDVPGEGGRHSQFRYQQRTVVLGTADKSQPEGTSTYALNRLHKTLRAAKELVTKLSRCGASLEGASSQSLHDIKRLHAKLVEVSRRYALPTSASQLMPDLAFANACVDTLQVQAFDLQESQAKACIAAWRSLMRQSVKAGGKASFSWLRDNWQPPVQALKDAAGNIATDPQQMASSTRVAWDELFNQPCQPSWTEFREAFADYIPHAECSLPNICAKDLSAQIRKTNYHRAVACDGWRVREVKALPNCILEVAASLYEDLEAGQGWATSNAHSIISCVPKVKTDLDSEDETCEPIFLSAFDCRPISNISVWSTLYSGLRFAQSESWRQSLLPPSMHGARKGHECCDAAFELALLNEYAHAKSFHLGGVSLDRKIFFDLLPHDLIFSLLEAMGLPKHIVAVERRFYDKLSCVYKVANALSQVSTRSNGFLQGCSFSLQAALSVLTVWTRLMETRVEGNYPITTGGFLDDNNFRCCGPDLKLVAKSLCEAWHQSERFHQLSGA